MAEPAVSGGRSFGQYEVESVLGRGAMGMVYLARDRRIGRRVALKTVQLDQKFEDESEANEFYKRLQREAEVVGAMQHPNIVTLYEPGYENNVISYLATEYVDGESLKDRLKRSKPLPVAEALRISEDLLRGLAYAHTKGIIHRDLKPANILLTSEGQAKIADFGVARPLNSSLTTTRSLVGTPNYMSPEQVKTTPVSTRSDLFSAGVVIYEMLTGTKPFASPDLSGILYNVVNHKPPLASEVNPAVPKSVARVISKLLAKKPEDRYATATETLEDLDRASRHVERPASEVETIPGPDDATTPFPMVLDVTAVPLVRRSVPPAVFWGVTLLLALALVGSVVLLRKRITSEKPSAVLTRAQIDEAIAKERALDAARTLAQAGRYEEALRDYDVYLVRYPQSVVARTERDNVARLFEASKPKAEITEVGRKTRPKKVEPPPEPPAKPLSRWQRLKKWFGGK